MRGLTHRYGRLTALSNLDLTVLEGSVYALLGPNGAGKTTLLQILMRLQRQTAGRVNVFGKDVRNLTRADRGTIAYVAEGQRMPGWMTVSELEAYLAPLYPNWDTVFASALRQRFRLDGGRKIRTLSKGERMKAALVCALAPRPLLLLMDEPFSGIDVVVKDEIVRGVLASAGTEGWTALVASHDIGELEMVADFIGVLNEGRLVLSESMDEVRNRFKRVEVVFGLPADDSVHRMLAADLPRDWIAVEQSGRRLRFLTTQGLSEGIAGGGSEPTDGRLARVFPDATLVEVEPASLREVYVALMGRNDDAFVLGGRA